MAESISDNQLLIQETLKKFSGMKLKQPHRTTRLVLRITAALYICGGGALAARGEVQPGDVVAAANVEQAKDLISPGIEWCVRHGLALRIAETRPIQWPKPYKEATEKYSGQVKLSSDGRELQNYVAGLPFPQIDVNDPQAALKIMWNYEYKFYITDDFDSRDFEMDSGTIGKGGAGMRIERHYIMGHSARLHYNGRLYVEPKPELPNPTGIRYRESVHPILEPFDLKGVGTASIRYIDAARQDDSWLYLPNLRRVRRLSTAQRSDALFGQDTDSDSFHGYSGHIAWMDWKLLGEKTILAAMHGEHHPVKWGDGSADFGFDDVWEKRPVYVIEGVSKLPQYAYSKRVIFIDKEAWVVPYSDIYDHAGALWKVYVALFEFKKQAAPGATLYDDEMGFNAAFFMVDTQLVHVTRAALPSQKAPQQESEIFNQGDKNGLTEDWFDVAHLIKTGQ